MNLLRSEKWTNPPREVERAGQESTLSREDQHPVGNPSDEGRSDNDLFRSMQARDMMRIEGDALVMRRDRWPFFLVDSDSISDLWVP